MNAATRKTPRKAPSVPLLDLYRTMALVREVEQALSRLFANSEVPGFIHLSLGQEAISAGVASALLPQDSLATTHRGHGHVLARGIDVDGFFKEIMGRAGGLCRGRGGSMHVADLSLGILGANGIVGAGIPIALGSAIAHAARGTGGVAVAFFGDGAMAEGVLHETLNMAALWKTPLLLVCENNGWSEFSPTARQLAADPCALAESHRITARAIDGNDAVAVHDATRTLVAEIRGGGGPRFLECRTTRVRGHFEGDPQKYRDAADAARSEDDPIGRLERRLAEDGVSESDIDAATRDAVARVDAAVERARAGTAPDFDAALKDVYAPAAEAAP